MLREQLAVNCDKQAFRNRIAHYLLKPTYYLAATLVAYFSFFLKILTHLPMQRWLRICGVLISDAVLVIILMGVSPQLVDIC